MERIALACSGGGYRAAGFHLGGMSYLNQLTYQGKPLLLDRMNSLLDLMSNVFLN
jgi:hypothetical protein